MTTRARTLSLVQASPGAYTREVARLLGVHESTADYHLHRLRTLGHVASARDGRTLRHYPKRAEASP